MCLADRLKLSPRETEIARAVVEGKGEHGISLQLGISSHTVHTHLERLYRKLRVNSRAELVVGLARCQFEMMGEPDSPLPPLCRHRAAGECPLDS